MMKQYFQYVRTWEISHPSVYTDIKKCPRTKICVTNDTPFYISIYTVSIFYVIYVKYS